MASTPEGRRLTEQHRQDQVALRAAFLGQFLQLWPLLDPYRLDETSPGWLVAVMAVLRPYRRRSAEITTNYFLEFRQAELPPAGPSPERPARSTPEPTRLAQPQPTRGVRAPARPVTRLTPRNRTPVQIDVPDVEPDGLERTRIEIPEIDWEPFDSAAEISLKVTGPVGQKSKTGRGLTPVQAKDVSLVEASGAASRHVLTGGRQAGLSLVGSDRRALGWIRVTDGDPCSFCAMLASRGPVFKDRKAFDESDHGPGLHRENPGPFDGPGTAKVHDHCACTLEAVYSKDGAWPGRAREFRRLWNEVIGFAPNNRFSGDEALREFRRAYERQRRASRDAEVA